MRGDLAQRPVRKKGHTHTDKQTDTAHTHRAVLHATERCLSFIHSFVASLKHEHGTWRGECDESDTNARVALYAKALCRTRVGVFVPRRPSVTSGMSTPTGPTSSSQRAGPSFRPGLTILGLLRAYPRTPVEDLRDDVDTTAIRGCPRV